MDDDGAHHSGMNLHPCGFTLQKVGVLINILRVKLGLEAGFVWNNGYPSIYIPAASMPLLRQ